MKTIYFIRHAESEGNARGILTGQLDLPLTPAGEAAARGASKHWERIKPEIVYCSALQRTQQTARLLFPHNVPIRDARLNERHYGLWQGRLKSELQELQHQHCSLTKVLGYSQTVPNGEDWHSMQSRVSDFLCEIASCEADPIICVCHRGVIRLVSKLLRRNQLEWFPPLSSLTFDIDVGASNHEDCLEFGLQISCLADKKILLASIETDGQEWP